MFSPPVLHFSTLHRRNLSVPLHCLSHLNVAWPVGEPNLPPALDRSVLHVRWSIGEYIGGFVVEKAKGLVLLDVLLLWCPGAVASRLR